MIAAALAKVRMVSNVLDESDSTSAPTMMQVNRNQRLCAVVLTV
jgi:hypothetical protein